MRSSEFEEQLTSRAAKIIVAICDRSPHSARKVNVNDCKNTREKNEYNRRRCGVLIIPVSASAVLCFSTCSKQSKYK